jgi:predicted metal-dependent hydrolase
MVLFRGEETRVEAVEEDIFETFSSIEHRNGIISLRVPRIHSTDAAELLKEWLQTEAKRELLRVVTARACEMRQVVRRVTFGDQRSVWGSCSKKNRSLSFNMRLGMAPPAVLDYIVVHELAHLTESNHSTRFWTIVQRYCPDQRLRRVWLRKNGWKLDYPVAIQIRQAAAASSARPAA